MKPTDVSAGSTERRDTVTDARRTAADGQGAGGETGDAGGSGATAAGTPTDTPAADTGECCRTLIVKVERITITDPTDGYGKDDVMITAASSGAEAVTPPKMSWPKGTDVELDRGEFTQPREVVRVTPAADTCEFSLDSVVRIWEAGPKDLDTALRATVVDLQETVTGLSAASGGWLALPVVGRLVHLVGVLFDNLIDLLELRDTLMGRIEISCEDRLTDDRPLKAYNWVFKSDEIKELSADEIRIERTLTRDGGEWAVWIDITRICR
jgi:hypothetical protein